MVFGVNFDLDCCFTHRELILEHLRNLTVKHLAYNTFFFFELLENFVKVDRTIVEQLMVFLLDQIKVVEAKRGGGADNRLRGCFEKLEGVLKR